MKDLLNVIEEYIDTLKECVIGYERIEEYDKANILKCIVDDLVDILKVIR